MTYKKTKYQDIEYILRAEKAGKKYCKLVKELRDYLLTGGDQTSDEVEEIKSKISKVKDRLDDCKERIDRDATERKIKDGEYLYGKPFDSGEVEELEIVFSMLLQYLSGGYNKVLFGCDVDDSPLTGDFKVQKSDDAHE